MINHSIFQDRRVKTTTEDAQTGQVIVEITTTSRKTARRLVVCAVRKPGRDVPKTIKQLLILHFLL